MEDELPGDVTVLLREVREGVPGAGDRLMARVYAELRAVAAGRAGGGGGSGGVGRLEPTALVHEAYLKLFGKDTPAFENRRHFFWAAAQAMRDILVDEARKAGAAKRGGGRKGVELLDVAAVEPGVDAVDLLALDEALRKLAEEHPLAAKVVTLRFFGGLSREEAAAELEISEGAYWREWVFAKAWLLAEIGGGSEEEKTVG